MEMDREKVIKGLEHCKIPYIDSCDNCPYGSMKKCWQVLRTDLLALLKEQDETINDLTDTIRQLNQHIKDLSEYMTPYGKVKDVKAYAELLKKQEAYGWRLCSDELPENDDEVLVTYIVNGNQKKRYVETASYFDHEEIDGHWNSVWDEYRVRGTKTEVIAWMPLPKPYNEGR